MSALWGAKQGSPPSKRSAVGLCLMYACIIVCVSRRPDLFILLGDEKRFWYAQGTWISTWSCLSAERSHYKFIRKSVYIPGKMYCTFALLWSFYMFFFYTKYCCFHLISHYSTFDWDLPWQQKTWMVWKRQYLNVKSHKYFRYVAWLILKVMFSAINCCWTKCPVQNWRYCTIATQKNWSSGVFMSLTY